MSSFVVLKIYICSLKKEHISMLVFVGTTSVILGIQSHFFSAIEDNVTWGVTKHECCNVGKRIYKYGVRSRF